LVKQGEIIGKGHTQVVGSDHAEICALKKMVLMLLVQQLMSR
jgi:pyrimidine deaminase RibD-like protein